jgi:hypothetical protein
VVNEPLILKTKNQALDCVEIRAKIGNMVGREETQQSKPERSGTYQGVEQQVVIW